MTVTSVLVLLLAAGALRVSGFDFPTDQEDRFVSSRRSCQAKDGGEGVCVSLLARSCLLYRSTAHLLLRRPKVCSMSGRDAIVCCPVGAVRVRKGEGGATTAAVTRRPTTTFRPATPERTTTQPPPRPSSATQPPVRTQSTVPPPPPPTSRAPQSTPPSGPRSSTRDLQSPIGLRPRPSLAPIVELPRQRSSSGFRLPGCGIRRPIAAFHARGDYFQRPPQFFRSERVFLGTQPWTALIGLREPETSTGGRWICAGALLTPRIVITSAQCVQLGGGPEQLLVGLGEHDLMSRTDGVAGAHAVLAVEWHPAWSQPERRHSLALLLLDRPADRSPLIQPVCLPPPDPARAATTLLPLPGTGVVEMAYGLDSTGMRDVSARNRLVTTAATVAPLGDCVAALAGAPLTEFLFPGGAQQEPDLCLAAGADCTLDVGAPVVAEAADGTVQLEALQLLDGCTAGQPRLLLRVRHYVPFIVQTIETMMQRFTANSL